MKRNNYDDTSIFSLIIVAVLLAIIYIPVLFTKVTGDYVFDVKTNLKTDIEITSSTEDVYNVKGNVFKFIEDPLTLYKGEEKVGYAGDNYNLVSQDDHSIYVNDEFVYNMIGKFKIFGDEYELQDADGNVIANAKFNRFNTKGSLADVNGSIIASYHSPYLRKDFGVDIENDTTISEEAIVMFFASYYSDQKADNKKN